MDKENAYVVAYADKTVLKIGGLSVRGLDTRQLEELLTKRLNSVVRVIGVTGASVDMDVYGVDETDIIKDADGIIQAVALADGITVSDLSTLVSAKKIVQVDAADIPSRPDAACAKERWLRP